MRKHVDLRPGARANLVSRSRFIPHGWQCGPLKSDLEVPERSLVTVALVFLLLLFLYETFRVAGAMLITTLLAVAGVYLGLWVTGTEFDITSRVGMAMIIGIVTEVAIFYYAGVSSLHLGPAFHRRVRERRPPARSS